MFRPAHCSRTDERASALMEFRKERLLCYVMTEKHTKKNDGGKTHYNKSKLRFPLCNGSVRTH